MDNIIQFPQRDPPEQQTEGMSLEDVVNIEFDEPTIFEQVAREKPKAEQPPFLDWVYVEVLDFQSYVAELCTVAEQQGEDAFWLLIAKLQAQINGWSPDGRR